LLGLRRVGDGRRLAQHVGAYDDRDIQQEADDQDPSALGQRHQNVEAPPPHLLVQLGHLLVQLADFDLKGRQF
jgi:hypothetical protein